MLRSILYYAALHCSITFILLIYFDPLAHLLRNVYMFKNNHIKREPAALGRAATFLEILFKSPHLLLGAAIWAYGAYWLLAVTGLA